MKGLFRRSFRISLSFHVGLLLLLAAAGWWTGRRPPSSPPAVLMVDLAPPRPAAPPRERGYRPVPAHRIRRSTRKVRRRAERVRVPRADELRRILSEGLPPTRTAETPLSAALPDWYYAAVKQRLYEAWAQPPGSEVPPGTRVRAILTVQRDGRVLEAKIAQPSGLRLMDDSVREALQATTSLDPLPSTYAGNRAIITVDFVMAASPSL